MMVLGYFKIQVLLWLYAIFITSSNIEPLDARCKTASLKQRSLKGIIVVCGFYQ